MNLFNMNPTPLFKAISSCCNLHCDVPDFHYIQCSVENKAQFKRLPVHKLETNDTMLFANFPKIMPNFNVSKILLAFMMHEERFCAIGEKNG